MHTFIVTVALIAAAPAATWDSSYSRGQEQGIALQKPLIVVFGSGSRGWESVIRSERPTAEVNSLLSERFVCVFADTATAKGMSLARDFELKEPVGFVISDKTGSYQAFWHQGDLTNQSLKAHLERYGDPSTAVRRTEAVVAAPAPPAPQIKPETIAKAPSPVVVAEHVAAAPTPAWQTSYRRGQELSAAEKKPLAVVFGSGPRGWASVAREEQVKPEVTQALSEHYVCVYVDTATAAGKSLAHDFSISGDVGMVISDRKGESQAFWHQGTLTSDNLAHYLTKYADPRVPVQTTETTNPPRSSYYGSPSVTRITSGNC